MRALTAADDDQVIDVLVASSLFDRGDVPLLRSLLTAHHDGTAPTGQRWIVVTGSSPAADGAQLETGTVDILGTALYRPVEAADRVWDLTMIAVSAHSQNLGFGRQLMEHIEGELRREEQRLIVVLTSGLPRFDSTRAFYRTLGYSQCGHVPDYWADGDDMLLYSKPLTSVRPSVGVAEGGLGGGRGRASGDLSIRTAGLDDLPDLRRLWLQLHHHHQAGLPHYHGFVTDDDQSWRSREAAYHALIEQARGFLLVAERDGTLLGYCAVELIEGEDDTFAVGHRHAEILTLVIQEGDRGIGLGTRLLDTVNDQLTADGVTGLKISVMHGNHNAQRFYERRGLVPTETYLWRTHPHQSTT